MAKAPTRILIGTSLTEDSDCVVAAGVAVAQATSASVWLVHAQTPYISFRPPMYPEVATVYAEAIARDAEKLQEKLTEQALRTGLSALAGFSSENLRLTIGVPHREISELAGRLEADLVVIGAAEAGRGGFGSTAERVIRKATCPVLVVRPGVDFPPVRVEIPVDLSPVSAHALREGLVFLAPLGTPLSATEVLFVLDPFEVGGSIHFEPTQITRFAGEELDRFVEANCPYRERLLQSRVETGYARQQILEALSRRRVDLAVLGTHGRSGFERLVLGSVAANVLRDSECNLLVVPPEVSHASGEASERRGTPVGVRLNRDAELEIAPRHASRAELQRAT